MSRGELAVWAWSGRANNFGDQLGPEILSKLGYRVRRVPLRDADLIACGSVVEVIASEARDGATIWGAGLMNSKPVNVGRFNVAAVRGALTRGLLGLDDKVAIGDPGGLVPQLWSRPKVRHRLGVVRHYVDQGSYPHADIVIDATEPIDQVVSKIGSCATIASSSLHGLIVAQAWDIPALRIPHNSVVGGNFKWMDWLTATKTQEQLLAALP